MKVFHLRKVPKKIESEEKKKKLQNYFKAHREGEMWDDHHLTHECVRQLTTIDIALLDDFLGDFGVIIQCEFILRELFHDLQYIRLADELKNEF